MISSAGSSTSQPNLSTNIDKENNDGLKTQITVRKRKQNDEYSVIKCELLDFRNEFMSLLSKFCDSQTEKQNKLFDEIKYIKMQLTEVKAANEILISENKKLQTELNSALNTISDLKIENNKRDQFSRINNVEISGVPITNGENLYNIIHSIYSKVGLKLEDNEIDYVVRVRRYDLPAKESNQSSGRIDSRPPAIIVRFTRRHSKDQMLAAVRARRGLSTNDIGISGPTRPLYIGDHLTPVNKLLLKRARFLKAELKYSYLWIRDCKIFMRKNDSSKVKLIGNDDDLNRLK